MAFSSSILSLALIQVILLASSTSAANTISIQFSKPLADNSTDDYLLPLSIGTPSQVVYLTPSTNTDDTFAISPKACTPPGNATALKGCVNYRGGVFGPKQSSSYKVGKNGAFEWKDNQYVLFAEGDEGVDTLHLEGNDIVSLDGFTFGVVGACNMTSAFLGLGPNSTLLERLVKDGKIESRSYGLHVGIDIENHAYPVLDPTFDESGEKPYDEADYNSGVGRRRRAKKRDTEAVREVHSFPGSLTLGGYDKSRIDNRTETLKAPITSDGKLELELTNMVIINSWMVNDNPAHDVFNGTRKVVIDSSTPYMYLPESTAAELSYSVEAMYGDPLEDFFYGSYFDKYIGNVTFTLQAPGGGASIDIVIPPTVLYQPITALRDYVPTGNDYFDHYLPIKTFKDSSKQPIILGRTFLKAVYLYVNHDKNNFQISQVAYTTSSPEIVAVAVTDSDSSDSSDKSTNSPTTDTSEAEERKPPILLIAAAAGAAGVFFALGVCFLLWRRRQNTKNSTLKPIPSTISVNNFNNSNNPNNDFHGNELDGSGMSGTPLVHLPSRDEKSAGGQNWGVWEQQKNGNGGYYTPHPLAGGTQYHEMESDYVGMATSPSQAYPPQWAELPAAPPPVHSQHPAFSGQQQQGPVPEVRYEMM